MRKQLMLLLVFGVGTLFGQNNELGANDHFYSFLLDVKTELKAGETWTNDDMLHQSNGVDKTLAWEFLWDKSSVTSPEETHSKAIGYVLNREAKTVAIVYFEGTEENLFYLVNIQVFNYKTGQKTDQLYSIAGFTKDAATCKMDIKSSTEIVFTSEALGSVTTIPVRISKKGRIER